MSRARCMAPDCGRYVKEGAIRCMHHPPPGAAEDLHLELELSALRSVLADILAREDIDAVTRDKATLVARVTGVAIQAVKAQYAMGEAGTASYMDTLKPILEGLEREAAAREGSQP